MNEAKKQLKRVFALYPSYRDYIERQDDSVATLQAWCRILSNFPPKDVADVVDQICSGRIEVRSKYSKADELPMVIASHCRKMSEDRQRFSETDELVQSSLDRRQSMPKHKHSIASLYSQVRQSWADVQRGDKTKDEHERFVIELRKRARETE